GVSFKVSERDVAGASVVAQVEMAAPVIGTFNVSNLLAVVGALRALDVSLAQASQACRNLRAVPGRMQLVRLPDPVPQEALPLVVVDYAHTPDALQKALEALRPVVLARQGRLWCVFGCGGNRDPIKRPLMGAVADQYADQVVLTSDNPRDEVPAYILSQILAGVARREGVDVFEDRREAIAHAVSDANPCDVVLIAGKGHESTQEVSGIKYAFSDEDESLIALRLRLKAGGQS
ncbi:MAG TPA: cyanophycin synthetase, partial [Aquabacterium sp.]|nr:cyanophycin synthetase [Aquabacterium sp.]